jgi:TfoX/Sxy family transcriptional regulator of competence genes
MPISPEAVRRVTAALRAARPVETKKMFGGLGIYHEGVFCAVFDDDRLFLKIDPASEVWYAERGAEPWSVTPGAYRELTSDHWDDANLVGERLDEARDAARRRKKKS